MTDVRNPSKLRRQLGRELRVARTSAGLTQVAVAKALDCGQAKINKIETSLVAVRPDELEAMIKLYNISATKAAELKELAKQDNQDGPRTRATGAWSAFGELSDREQDASEILCWHSEGIPGPLQSERYMLELHRPDTLTNPDVVRLIRQRQARARIFTIEDPPRYRIILSESSLHRMPGGRTPELVLDQTEHLLKLICRHNQRLELQILPFEADVRFVGTDFEILHFPDAQPSFAYIEHPSGADLFKRREGLKELEKHWQQLHSAALGRHASQAFLEQMAATSRSS